MALGAGVAHANHLLRLALAHLGRAARRLARSGRPALLRLQPHPLPAGRDLPHGHPHHLRDPVPVLAGVRLEADESSLVLASFDYEVSTRCQVPADVEEGGVVLVSGRLLAEIAKSLPTKPVDLEVEGYYES